MNDKNGLLWHNCMAARNNFAVFICFYIFLSQLIHLLYVERLFCFRLSGATMKVHKYRNEIFKCFSFNWSFFFCECFSLSAAGQCRKSIMQTENRKLFFDDSFSSCLYCSLLPPNHPHKFSNFLRVEMQQQKLYLLTMRKKSSSFRDESKKYNYATKISLRKITKQNFLCFQTKKLWKLRK